MKIFERNIFHLSERGCHVGAYIYYTEWNPNRRKSNNQELKLEPTSYPCVVHISYEFKLQGKRQIKGSTHTD